MSTKRSPYDFYPTPQDVIDKFFDNYTVKGNIFYEPCAGDGRIVQTIRQKYPQSIIFANEVDESHREELSKSGADQLSYEDFLKCKNNSGLVDWVITNPPFSLAQEFIEHSFTWSFNVAMLLRLNFLGSQKRHDFWLKNPPNKIMVLSKRPSFTGSGTDSQEYAWFIWDNQKHENPITVI